MWLITLSDLPVQSISNRVFVNGETCNRDHGIVTSSQAAKFGATSYPVTTRICVFSYVLILLLIVLGQSSKRLRPEKLNGTWIRLS